MSSCGVTENLNNSSHKIMNGMKAGGLKSRSSFSKSESRASNTSHPISRIDSHSPHSANNRILLKYHLPLLRLNDVPQEVHEFAVISRYRPPKCTLLECFLSVFQPNNEAVNFWTHFLPALFFLGQIIQYGCPSDDYSWPMFSYLCTAFLYLIMSAMAHMFCCLNIPTRRILFLIDYACISMYSFGTGLLIYSYGFPEQYLLTRYWTVYLYGCGLMSLLSTAMAIASTSLPSTSKRMKLLRIAAFILPYLWVTFPVALRTNVTIHHKAQFIFISIAAFCYGTHIPERFAPGWFDLIGHSHNILHFFGTLATISTTMAGFNDKINQNANSIDYQIEGSDSLALITIMFGLNACLILIYLIMTKKKIRTNYPVLSNLEK